MQLTLSRVDEVLFLPQFQTNLISISKLTINLDCQLKCTYDMCTIHGNQLKTIDLDKLFHGLYHLKTDNSLMKTASCNRTSPIVVNTLHSTNSLSDFALWHLKLGHLSNDWMHTLHTVQLYSYTYSCCL
jgi:hypothetical protein